MGVSNLAGLLQDVNHACLIIQGSTFIVPSEYYLSKLLTRLPLHGFPTMVLCSVIVSSQIIVSKCLLVLFVVRVSPYSGVLPNKGIWLQGSTQIAGSVAWNTNPPCTRVVLKVLPHIFFSEYIYSKWLKFGDNINECFFYTYIFFFT
jgi:hypothetical protein